jgi:hypothetical protein
MLEQVLMFTLHRKTRDPQRSMVLVCWSTRHNSVSAAWITLRGLGCPLLLRAAWLLVIGWSEVRTLTLSTTFWYVEPLLDCNAGIRRECTQTRPQVPFTATVSPGSLARCNPNRINLQDTSRFVIVVEIGF